MHESPFGGPVAGMVSIDFDRARELARSVREIALALSTGSPSGQASALDTELIGRLGRLDRAWKDERHRVSALLDDVAGGLFRAVVEYEKTNDIIASAATSR